ncbi:major capsid protein [Flyfo microvirus Tbat1_66]|nr:major capsid protein [Flyfo microvirus Tbat1_66]
MKRSKFNLSHTQLTTTRMGTFLPIGVTEVLPGDTVQHAAQALVRAAPLATPPMHPVRIDIRHFFVPHRLVWDNWENFITGGPDGNDASVFPTFEVPVQGTGEFIFDNLGIPPFAAGSEVNVLPIRGLCMIWNEYYRDQDLQTPIPISKADGLDATAYPNAMHVNWEKDYFTTCRPWEQKGPDVLIPIGTSATGTATILQGGQADGTGGLFNIVRGEADTGGQASVDLATGTIGIGTALQLVGDVDVDLTTATAASVNDLRLALSIQRFQEARARYGSRYTEYLRYLGVRSSDARLQRPEYLGGGRTNLQFSEVLSTSVDATDTAPFPLPGAFGGHGIGANRTNRYRKFFEEHGYIISVMSVVPQTMYPDGLFRHWNRRTKEDFFQKELQHIGQQAVLNKEVVADHNDPDGVFGYQDRYDEYRRAESQVHGKFRAGQYLDDWHFARRINNNAALNAGFVQAQPVRDPFQFQGDGEDPADTLYIAIRHQIVARRIVAARGSSFIL